MADRGGRSNTHRGIKRAGAAKQTGGHKKAAGRRKATPRGAVAAPRSRTGVSEEARYLMIQEAAYFRAEREAFRSQPVDCWLAAEAEIDARIDDVK